MAKMFGKSDFSVRSSFSWPSEGVISCTSDSRILAFLNRVSLDGRNLFKLRKTTDQATLKDSTLKIEPRREREQRRTAIRLPDDVFCRAVRLHYLGPQGGGYELEQVEFMWNELG